MAKFLLPALAAILLTSGGTQATENTGSNVATSLRICYNTTELHDHNQRLPSTINMLIDLIRIVEDSSVSMDARTLSIQLAHRFRQDGIVKATENPNVNVLPYSPKGEEAFKNKIMLDKLLPGDATRFPEQALSIAEQCGLHFMTSNNVELRKRGDESTVCKQTSQYRRRPRAAVNDTEKEDFGETADLTDNVEQVAVRLGRVGGLNNDEVSDCPIENGVVYTRWGNVQAGTLLTAIASGYETQNFITDEASVDSKYAVTIAGDLVEVAFLEATTEVTYTIGAKGGFNSTLAPHTYFKDGKQRVFLTDPELRADLDGLVLASNVLGWANKHRTIKVSQILDAYYSNRGLFSSNIKACNRNKFLSEYAPTEKLIAETISFATLYNTHTTFGTSPDAADIERLSKQAVDAFQSAITKIADAQCDDLDLDRTATDLIIAIDTTWSFDYIHRTVSYILDNLDINKYESNYTVINAQDGSILVNSTWSLARFAQDFNMTVYEKSQKGFESTKVMTAIEDLHEQRAEQHKEKSRLNGKSSTVLLMPKQTDSSKGSYINSRFSSVMDSYYPGTQYIVLASGSRDVYNSFVRNPSTDIYIVPEYISNNENDVKMTLNTLITRLREVPRKIINPKCGSDMSGDTSSDSMELYVEPGTTSYYKVAKQFVSGEGTKTLKIRPMANGNITICSSQNDAKPTENCEVLGSGERSFSLSSGSDFNFALVAGHTPENSNVRCSDKGCRFPDNLKVTIQLDGFTCTDNNSGVRITNTFTGFVTVIAVYLINKLY